MSLDPKKFSREQRSAIEAEVYAAMTIARKNALLEALAWLDQVSIEVLTYRPTGRRWAQSALAALRVNLDACLRRGMPYEPFGKSATDSGSTPETKGNG